MYDILTGNFHYMTVPWEQEELDPDLILTWKIPTEQYIEKSSFLNVDDFVNCPSQNNHRT